MIVRARCIFSNLVPRTPRKSTQKHPTYTPAKSTTPTVAKKKSFHIVVSLCSRRGKLGNTYISIDMKNPEKVKDKSMVQESCIVDMQ